MISFGYWANTCTVVDLGTLKSEQQLKAAPFIGDDKQCMRKERILCKKCINKHGCKYFSLSCLLFDFLCVCSVEKSTSALLSTKAFKNSEPRILTLHFKKKKYKHTLHSF